MNAEEGRRYKCATEETRERMARGIDQTKSGVDERSQMGKGGGGLSLV
jgi:hypothetical protein